ncbi:MAG: hypothetical protein ACO2ZM_01900 [Francisellaceae bacterium]
MKFTYKKLLLTLGSLTALGLSGCANMNETTQNAINNINNTNAIMKQVNESQPNPLISYNHKIYIASEGFQIKTNSEKLPAVFDESFVFSSKNNQSFQYIVNALENQTGINIRMTDDAKAYLKTQDSQTTTQSNAQTQLSQGDSNTTETEVAAENIKSLQTPFYFNGKLSQLLDRLTAHHGLWWRYDETNHSVVIFRDETKTFAIDMLSGESSTSMTLSNSAQTQSATQKTTTSYSSGKNNPWNSILATVQAMIGSEGKVIVSETDGYVTVSAIPSAMNRVEQYIKALNSTARKRIAIRIDVYDVQSANSASYGLDWDALYKITDGEISWNTTSIPNPLSDPFSSAIETATVSGSLATGPFAGSKLIIDALQKLGKTTYITGTTIYTVNSRSVPVQVSRSTDYVKEVSVTPLTNSDGSVSDQSQTSVTPGTIHTGYSIVVTPKIIKGNEVLLNLSVNISSLLAMREKNFSSGDSDNPNTIELPETRDKTFMQTVPLESGQTAVLAGFQSNTDNSGTNSIGPASTWMLGGKKSTNHERTVTVVIVTPYIISSH